MEDPHLHHISEFSTEALTNPEVTPEELSIMKLKDSMQLSNRQFLSQPGSPTGNRKSYEFSNGMEAGRSSSVARSSRQVSTSSRRSNTFRHSHGSSSSKVSLELTRKAEGKFFALMDLVSNASREASSLKSFWSDMIQERESLAREREELLEQVTEISETLEHTESQQHNHSEELSERKIQVEKLLLELSRSLNTISEHKKKGTDREHELLRTRNELQGLRDSLSHSSITHEKLKSDFEAIELKLRASEDERDHNLKTSEQYQEELRSLTREYTELKSSSTDTIFKLETARKEVLASADRLKISEMEKDSYLAEKERLQDLLRKSNVKNDETSLELFEMTEKLEHQLREFNKFRETIRDLEAERDKYSNTVDHLRRELKTKNTSIEEIETRAADITLRYEHLKRENTTIKEKLGALELEQTGLQEIIERTREESRLVALDKNKLRDDMEMWRHRCGDKQRLIGTLQESLRKAESTVVDIRSEVHTLTDRISQAERERGESHDKNDRLNLEIVQLKEKLVIVQGELRGTNETRDRLREELHEYKSRYEEVTETMTEYRDNSGGFEFEIENLRSLLREAREQKERAITARNAADRERDEYINRYEDKCREMERFEQNASSHFHAARSEGGRVSRVVSRMNTTGTTIHNEHGSGDIRSSEFGMSS